MKAIIRRGIAAISPLNSRGGGSNKVKRPQSTSYPINSSMLSDILHLDDAIHSFNWVPGFWSYRLYSDPHGGVYLFMFWCRFFFFFWNWKIWKIFFSKLWLQTKLNVNTITSMSYQRYCLLNETRRYSLQRALAFGKKRSVDAVCAYFRKLLVFSSNLHNV